MAEVYDVELEVVKAAGNCDRKHRPGDKFLVTGYTPAGVCLAAFNALLPAIRTLSLGGVHPWEADPDVAHVTCPDGANPVTFRLSRVRK